MRNYNKKTKITLMNEDYYSFGSWYQDNKDWVNPALSVAGTIGGAAIGSVVAPGLGTGVGAMLGSSIGGSAMNLAGTGLDAATQQPIANVPQMPNIPMQSSPPNQATFGKAMGGYYALGNSFNVQGGQQGVTDTVQLPMGGNFNSGEVIENTPQGKMVHSDTIKFGKQHKELLQRPEYNFDNRVLDGKEYSPSDLAKRVNNQVKTTIINKYKNKDEVNKSYQENDPYAKNTIKANERNGRNNITVLSGDLGSLMDMHSQVNGLQVGANGQMVSNDNNAMGGDLTVDKFSKGIMKDKRNYSPEMIKLAKQLKDSQKQNYAYGDEIINPIQPRMGYDINCMWNQRMQNSPYASTTRAEWDMNNYNIPQLNNNLNAIPLNTNENRINYTEQGVLDDITQNYKIPGIQSPYAQSSLMNTNKLPNTNNYKPQQQNSNLSFNQQSNIPQQQNNFQVSGNNMQSTSQYDDLLSKQQQYDLMGGLPNTSNYKPSVQKSGLPMPNYNNQEQTFQQGQSGVPTAAIVGAAIPAVTNAIQMGILARQNKKQKPIVAHTVAENKPQKVDYSEAVRQMNIGKRGNVRDAGSLNSMIAAGTTGDYGMANIYAQEGNANAQMTAQNDQVNNQIRQYNAGAATNADVQNAQAKANYLNQQMGLTNSMGAIGQTAARDYMGYRMQQQALPFMGTQNNFMMYDKNGDAVRGFIDENGRRYVQTSNGREYIK